MRAGQGSAHRRVRQRAPSPEHRGWDGGRRQDPAADLGFLGCWWGFWGALSCRGSAELVAGAALKTGSMGRHSKAVPCPAAMRGDVPATSFSKNPWALTKNLPANRTHQQGRGLELQGGKEGVSTTGKHLPGILQYREE